jgi:hypothetical protein
MLLMKYNMKSLRISFIPMAIVAAMMLAGACQSGQKRSPVLIEDANDLSSTGGIESLTQIYHLYPSPAEMLSVIDLTEISFDGSILNPTERADQYTDSKLKNYVLGIYMTDLAYAALFGRHEETLDYLETVKSLAEEINISEAVDESMIEKARNNVEFLDSLYNISNDAFMNILNYCEKNERSNTVVMISAGAFTESLYLAVQMIDDYGTADQMMQHLADQKYSIHNFMLFANSIKSDDPGVISTIRDLEKIESIFSGIKAGTGGVTVTTAADSDAKQPKKLVISGSGKASQPHLTEEEFEALKAEVLELRNKIVEGKL